MKDLLSLLKGIKEKRKLILELSKADFKKRFVGSYFGVVWMFIQPMVTIAIYAFIFGEHGMKNAPRHGLSRNHHPTHTYEYL